MRRISLSVLAGVALLGATAVLLHGVGAGLSQPVMRVSAQLVSVAPSGLAPRAAPRPAAARSALRPLRAQLLATLRAWPHQPAHRSTAIQAPSIQAPQGMTCPAATGSRPGGCSIVPCAVYVGAGQTSYTVTPGTGPGVAILPRVIPRPSPGGRTPAGTCVSRPGRPPQMRWVSSTGH